LPTATSTPSSPSTTIIFALKVVLVHRSLDLSATGNDSIRVCGYKEEGTTTPSTWPIKERDRFLLVGDVVDGITKLGERAAFAKQASAARR
jgi:xylulose-5-phosphate/fructose-6-phosphate phosphoketolase